MKFSNFPPINSVLKIILYLLRQI